MGGATEAQIPFLDQRVKRELTVLKRQAKVAVSEPLRRTEPNDVLMAHLREHARLVFECAFHTPALPREER